MRQVKPIMDRFMAKIEPVTESGCWIWTGSLSPNGYGQSSGAGHRVVNAHRLSYELFNGPIPVGLCVRHTCHVRQCVNPRHLILGTHKENMQDNVLRGAQAKGERVGTSKLTEEDVRAILSSPLTDGKVAKQFGIGRTTVRRVRDGETWKHLQSNKVAA